MLKYAKIINEETKLCDVGLGTNAVAYEKMGFVVLDVEQSDIDNNWYLSEYCPHKTEEEKAREERERLDNLTRTRSEVWRALINARMFTKSDVKELIEAMPEETTEQLKAKELARVDVDDVEDFHRGHALVNMVGEYLEISSENLDNYFETGDYHYLEIYNSQE